MENNKWDERFDRAVEEAVRSELQMEVPDPEASWLRVQAVLRKKARRRRIRQRFQMAAMAAVAMLVGVLLFGQPQETEAFLPVTKIVNGVKDGVVTLFQGDKKKLEEEPKGMKTGKPPGEGEDPNGAAAPQDNSGIAIRVEAKTVEEARQAAGSLLPAPVWLPEDYRLDAIQLALNAQKKIVSGYFRYTGSGGHDFSFSLSASSMDQMSSIQSGKEDARKPVRVGDRDAVWLQGSAENSRLYWADGMYTFQLAGDLTEEEALRMAESVR